MAKKVCAAAFLSLALVACGTTSEVRVAAPVQQATSFDFRDERPADNRASNVAEGMAGTSTFYGDDKLSPSAPELTQAWLQKAFGSELAGKTVTLRLFTVSVFDPGAVIDEKQFDAATRNARQSVPGYNPAAGALGALLARPIIYGIESMKMQKSIYVRIEGEVDERRFSVIHAEQVRGRVTERNVVNTITRGLERLVGELKGPAVQQ
jgi:hypothetical protein